MKKTYYTLIAHALLIIMLFAVIFLANLIAASLQGTSCEDKSSIYKKVLTKSAQAQKAMTALIGANQESVISTLGAPTEIKEWGSNAEPLLLYKMNKDNTLTIYVSRGEVVHTLLIVSPDECSSQQTD